MSNKPIYSRRLLDWHGRCTHGLIIRRQFLDRAASVTVSDMSAAALLDSSV